jgi:predicted TIM-barrel fold metal-dependent hydrolase
MFIVDAQIHIWAPNSPERPWRPGQNVHREIPLNADEVLREMASAGVSRAILVPPSLDDDRNDLCLAAAAKHRDRFAVMGRLDPELPNARELMKSWRDQTGMLGLRYSLNRKHWIPILEEGRVDWLWREAEELGLPVMMNITHSIAPLIDKIAAQFSGLKILIGHLGLGHDKYDEDAFKDFAPLLALADRPNIAINASALPCSTKDSYPFRRLHPFIKQAFDAFGPERMFWGSDLSRLPCSYRESVMMFTEEIPWLSSDDKALIMGIGLCRWLGWKLPADLEAVTI